METQDELQPWQKDILEMEINGLQEAGYNWGLNSYFEKEDRRFYLIETQKEMLKKVLGGDFHISNDRDRGILEAILELGFYFKRDKLLLNKVRRNFLKGMNWIK